MAKTNKKQKAKTKNQQSTTSKQQLETKLTWLPKKTFELEFSVPWEKVKDTYSKTLKEVAKTADIKGFRKGKAPVNLVEKQVDKQKLYEEVVKKLLPETYQQAVKKHNLRPIMNPKISVVNLKENQNWSFKAKSCEAPEIKLGDYQKFVKGELAKESIWTPDKGDPEKSEKEKPGKSSPEKDQQSYDKKLGKVTQALIQNIKVELSDLLIEDEVNRMLSRLLDQVNSLGMTIEQYLNSKNQNKEQLKMGYTKQAENTLKIEFILQAIVQDRNIEVSKEEIDKMIASTPDEKVRKNLDTPMQRAYISSILAKRKALDFLTSL